MTPQRVLLVEDEAVIQRLCSRMLTARGHTLSQADGVAKAVALIQPNAFDLLITDIRLPDGNGAVILDHFLERCPTGKAIVMSGAIPKWDNWDENPAKDRVCFLPKPFDLGQFEQIVNDVLTGASNGAA